MVSTKTTWNHCCPNIFSGLYDESEPQQDYILKLLLHVMTLIYYLYMHVGLWQALVAKYVHEQAVVTIGC